MGTIRYYGKTVLLSYGVLSFTSHPIPALLIFTATFFYPIVGLMGLVGNVTSNLVAKWIHAHRGSWEAGIFGVSGILVGLALGMYAEPSLRMWIFLIAGAAFTGILSVMLGNFFVRYDLPILSLPFMMVIWLLLLTIGVAKGDASMFPAIPFLYRVDLWLFNALPLELFEYVKMFGNILFQENLLSGVLVFTAILLFSRISALYGLWGGLLGMVTYYFIHGSLDGFHGLNYVLVALAFGGFFIVNNRHAFIFTSLAIFLVGIVDQAVTQVLRGLSVGLDNELPSLVFAFNTVTLAFLFPLKMLPGAIHPLRLTPVPLHLIKNPETNLRWYRRWSSQVARQRTILTFPFIGEWSVLQGNNGEWTHKGIGRFAWDFVVRDERGYQTSGIGLKVEEYYAFGLPVLAPAPGTIVSIENTVEDNPPQKANTERNWGNYVIIDHGNGEFSELSHFKQGSVVVVPGQQVQRGALLGYCGNSGRSPV
ncbi:MAG: peptidoglycan DD-metalloendopeptidase family protein, partial [FCB group bacterium]|nr:peptidoglycan DD-metalloendopeptidase family protein [FCB group bacterium]